MERRVRELEAELQQERKRRRQNGYNGGWQQRDMRATAPVSGPRPPSTPPPTLAAVDFNNPPRGMRRPLECYHCKQPHFLIQCPTYTGCSKCGMKTHTADKCHLNRSEAPEQQL